MISLHVLPTKSRTKISVPIGTPIPTKPSGQKLAREVSREVCQSRAGGDDALRYIKRDLLCDTLSREDGGLRDVELQTIIYLENNLKLHQDLKGYR
jgi:hypothetical protein